MQILNALSSRFVASVAKLRSVTTRDLKHREPVYLGRTPGRAYVVKRGYVRLVHVQPEGKPVTRMLLGKGAMFGDLPFSPNLVHFREQALASGLSCVIEVDRQEVEKQAIAMPDFQSLLLQIVSTQFEALDRRLQWQLISPLRTRIAAAVADLVCFTGGRCAHGHLIDMRLTHEEFAELVVAARPVVSAILAELKMDGMLDYTRSHLCVLNLDRLLAIVEGTP